MSIPEYIKSNMLYINVYIFNNKEENFSVEDQLNVSEHTIVALHIIHPNGILFTTTTRYSCLMTLQGKDKYYRYLKSIALYIVFPTLVNCFGKFCLFFSLPLVYSFISCLFLSHV